MTSTLAGSASGFVQSVLPLKTTISPVNTILGLDEGWFWAQNGNFWALTVKSAALFFIISSVDKSQIPFSFLSQTSQPSSAPSAAAASMLMSRNCVKQLPDISPTKAPPPLAGKHALPIPPLFGSC